jgi:hypothetical protein
VQQKDRIVAPGTELAVGVVGDPQFRQDGAVFKREVVDVENLRFGAHRASKANRQGASQESPQLLLAIALVKILFDNGIAPQLESISKLLG